MIRHFILSSSSSSSSSSLCGHRMTIGKRTVSSSALASRCGKGSIPVSNAKSSTLHRSPSSRSGYFPSRRRLDAPRRYLRNRALSTLPTTTHDTSSSSSSTLPTTTDATPSVPIDFNTCSQILGEESQILQIHLTPNQSLRAESGAMLFMTEGIEMSTSLGGRGDASSTTTTSAVKDGFQRMLTGQNLFVSDYTYRGDPGTVGTVGLSTAFPSKILRLSLREYGGKIVCQKGAYLASDSRGVDIEVEFAKKFTAGFFGGEGFVLQALVGEGDVFVKAGGTLVKRELGEGEVLRVSSGSLVGFTGGVEFDVQMVSGFKNVMFGGEGLFVTTLTGPGTVWLQGMAPDRMMSEILRRMPSGGGLGIGIPVGMGGGGADAGAGAGDGTDGGVGSDAGGGQGDNGGSDAEEIVAATDAAQAADRNATIASSGYPQSDDSSESATSLFGDAAPKEEPSYGSMDEDAFSSSSSSSSMPELEDATSFSTEETDFSSSEDEFTTLEQEQEWNDFEKDETSFSTGMDDSRGGSGMDGSQNSAEDSGGGLFGMLWDFLTKDDDE